MDPTSFINFTIGTQPSTTNVNVSALVSPNNKIVVTLVRITGTEEGNNFSTYPNPAVDYVRISGLSSGTFVSKVMLTDLLGRQHFPEINRTRDGVEVNLSGYPKGLYILNLVSEDVKTFFGSKISIE